MTQEPDKTVLAISSEVGVGAVGLTISRHVFAYNQVHAICLPTVILPSRPDLGTVEPHIIPSESLQRQLSALSKDGWDKAYTGVMTGYFADVSQVEVIAAQLMSLRGINPEAIILVDPVLGDFDTGLYVSEEVATAVRDLLVPLADVITPNLFEYSWLCGDELCEQEDIALEGLHSHAVNLAAPHIIVTSAKIEQPSEQSSQALIKTAYLSQDEMELFSGRFVRDMPKGTGDIFASHLLSRLVLGDEMKDAIGQTVHYLDRIAERAKGTQAIAPYLLFNPNKI
jgi:pyridoxine kinase